MVGPIRRRILEAQGKSVKCELSNDPFVPAAIILYQATGNASYLTKAEAIHAWVRTNLYDTTDGHVNGCTGQGSDTIYDDGLYIEAATSLYRITGNRQYYDDALKTADLEVARHPIMTEDYVANGPFGADQFFCGLSDFARENNLWSRYSGWFHSNATAAWNQRRTDYNITHDGLSTATPTGGSSNMSALEMLSAMVLQQVAVVADVAAPFDFSGHYGLLNALSNMAVSVAPGTTGQDAPILQESLTGEDAQLFTPDRDRRWLLHD